MKSFAYRAFTSEGGKKNGLIVAEDRADAAKQLRAKGLFPENIVAQTDGADHATRGRARRMDNDMQAVFARQLAVLLSADLPLDDALSVIRSSSGTGVMDQVASRVRSRVREGATLSEALDKGASGFAPYVISAVRAGEASRDLKAVFETIADHLETRRTDRTALATTLIYPAFVATVAMIVCAVLMVTVAPELAAMFETTGRPLPPITAFMLGATSWIGRHYVALALLATAIVIGVPLLLRRPAIRDRWHNALLRLPIVGRLMKLDSASQYLRTLALVVGSRQPVVEGVRNATNILTIQQYRQESDLVTDALHAGSALSAALALTTFIPPVAHQLVEAGEKSARVAQMTERAALLVETMLINDRKRLATLLDPMLMMIIGVFVLIIVLSVLLPIFDMQSAIQL